MAAPLPEIFRMENKEGPKGGVTQKATTRLGCTATNLYDYAGKPSASPGPFSPYALDVPTED